MGTRPRHHTRFYGSWFQLSIRLKGCQVACSSEGDSNGSGRDSGPSDRRREP